MISSKNKPKGVSTSIHLHSYSFSYSRCIKNSLNIHHKHMVEGAEFLLDADIGAARLNRIVN